MIGKYAQRQLYNVINRPPVYCFIAIAVVTFFLGFATNMVAIRWFEKCPVNAKVDMLTDTYIGKTKNIDISRYVGYEPIDVVFTWVNGSDPHFLKELEKYLALAGKKDQEETLKDERKRECKLDNCVPNAAIVTDEGATKKYAGLADCLKSMDEGVIVMDDDNDNVRFMAFPKVLNETQCSSNFTSDDKAKLKCGCLTSSILHSPSASHPFAFYVSPLKKLGTFKDARSLRESLPSSVANALSDLKLDVDGDFALLLFTSEARRDIAEKALHHDFEIKSDSPSVLAAFIVECTDFMGENVLNEEAKPKRYVDNEELRFSLRSLDKFAPWVRHVYLVTNGQVPYWLDLENPHLTLVSHEDVFGELAEQVLPTFSSQAIESQLFNIKGLGDYFIYFNDDFFLGQPVYPEDFITHSLGQKFYVTFSLPNCAPGCPHTWIRDGYCDRTCNNVDCDFDGGDCTEQANATTQPVPLQPMDLKTAMDRAYCSNGCSNAWVADGFCDSFCNVPSCAFDAGDCGVAKLTSPDYDFFNFSPSNASNIVVNVPPRRHIAVGNFSAIVPRGKEFRLGTCSTNVTPTLRTSSFIASHSIFVLIAYRNTSNSTFTANCELTFADDNYIRFSVTFDTFVPPPTKTTRRKAKISPKRQPKLIDLKKSTTCLFDQYPLGKRRYVISLCARLIPLVRRRLMEFRNGELTKYGLGVFLSTLTEQNVTCSKEFIRHIHFDVGSKDRSNSSGNFRKKKIPGLAKTARAKRQTTPSLILSHFTPQSLNPHVESASQAQLPPDAYTGSLLHVNRILNRDFGYAQRRIPAHAPLLIQRKVAQALFDRYRDEWLATASKRFRSYSDMQMQFSYIYYVASMKQSDRPDLDAVIEQIFLEEVDADESGDLNGAELRTLLIRTHGSSHSLDNWRVFSAAMGRSGCFGNLTSSISAFQENASNDGSTKLLMLDDAKRCLPLRELFIALAKMRPLYKSELEVADDDSVVFKMLESDVKRVESWLNTFRKRPPKYFCLNDDMDRSDVETTQQIVAKVQEFLHEKFPLRSQFELPANYRNRFATIGELRQFKAELIAQKKLTNVALVFVTVLLVSLTLFRWKHIFQKIWRSLARSVYS